MTGRTGSGTWRRTQPVGPGDRGGGNSFITRSPGKLQESGTVLLRDASANKCGVISSSYEIIANLLMSGKEFLDTRRVRPGRPRDPGEARGDEAELIFRPGRSPAGRPVHRDLKRLSWEINGTTRSCSLFRGRRSSAWPPLPDAILAHLRRCPGAPEVTGPGARPSPRNTSPRSSPRRSPRRSCTGEGSNGTWKRI